MLRISKKLIDFYRRRTEGKRAWIRFVAIVLAMGSIVAFFLYHTLTVKDTREAQTTVEESFAFVKAQLVKYDNYASSDKAKSLVRLMDKADEAARVLRDEPGFGVDGLENYAREQRLDGILVLDSQLNTVMETEFGGDTRARWQSVIESKNVASIVDYPVKSYMTRVQLEGETYDVAVVARRDAKGIVLAYTSKHDLVGSLGDVTLGNMFDGLQFNMDGVVVVAQNDKVVATNSSMLSGLSLEEALTLSDKEYARDRGGLYSVSYGGRTWLGDQQQMNEYTIYIFFPAKAVYATRTTVMGVAMGMFVLIWMSFVVLRFASERASLEQSRKRMETINALSKAYTSMYVVKVPSGKMEYIVNSDDGCDLSCKNASENTHAFLDQYFDPKDYDEVEAFLDMHTVEERLRGERYISHTYRSQSGRWYCISLVAQSYDKNGKLTSILIAARDCTAEKESEQEQQRRLREVVEQTRRADAAKTDFLRRMSHDIRTPINGIRGMVEIARHYRGDEARQEECLNKIMSASGFLLELVNNVLDMNKLESGEVQMENKPFDVCDLVEEAAVIIEAQTVEKTVTLHKEIHHDGHCHVFGSPLHVRQVLQNLLGNAVKYNKVGGEIFLTSREIALTEDTVTFEFTVRDTGKGMSEAFQQRAFEPFAQEEASARSSYVGTGLGLAIVKELVEKMGGEITLQSEKNVGSTFTVRLTFKQDKDAQRADDDAHGGAVSIRGTKVLLVEDNDLNMEIAEFMLQNEGVVVTKAADGRQAVDAFAASKPGDIDVILMDVMMPVMDGLEAARRIRSLNRPDAKTIPIFAMTANAFADDAERSRQAGMNEHLTKPLDAQVLLKTIGKYRKQGK